MDSAPHGECWSAISAETTTAIEQKASSATGNLLQVSPDIRDEICRMGGTMMRQVGRSFLRRGKLASLGLSRIADVLEQLTRVSAALDATLAPQRALEARHAETPVTSPAGIALLVLVGLLVPTAATIAIALLLFGPVTRFLTVPLLADAMHQSASLLGQLAETLGLSAGGDTGVLEMLSPPRMFALGACTTSALAVAVVFAPDVACLLGRAKGFAPLLLIFVAKLAFASSFFVVRTEDLGSVRLPVVAGSAFELSIMAASSWTTWLVGRQLDQARECKRVRATAEAGINAISVWQARLLARIDELTHEATTLQNGSFRYFVDEAAFLAEIEQYGRTVADLSILKTLAANNRSLQEATAPDQSAAPRCNPEHASFLQRVKEGVSWNVH